jgi:D-alanyl-D-alanine carboxypeptidase
LLVSTTLSANDAATALGQYLGGGSISRFAGMMTARAHQLGMLRTQFANPSGLPNPAQVTDAYDMAILARHLLLDYPQYRYLFSVPKFTFEGRVIPNIDGMLKRYPGAIGMKTGFTNLARFNLVTAAVRNGHLLIGVELHAHSWRVAYSTMAQLLDQGFAADGAGSAPLTLAANRPSAALVITRAASHMDRPTAPTLRVADITKLRTHPVQDGRWIAQVGSYDNYPAARRPAGPRPGPAPPPPPPPPLLRVRKG